MSCHWNSPVGDWRSSTITDGARPVVVLSLLFFYTLPWNEISRDPPKLLQKTCRNLMKRINICCQPLETVKLIVKYFSFISSRFDDDNLKRMTNQNSECFEKNVPNISYCLTHLLKWLKPCRMYFLFSIDGFVAPLRCSSIRPCPASMWSGLSPPTSACPRWSVLLWPCPSWSRMTTSWRSFYNKRLYFSDIWQVTVLFIRAFPAKMLCNVLCWAFVADSCWKGFIVLNLNRWKQQHLEQKGEKLQKCGEKLKWAEWAKIGRRAERVDEGRWEKRWEKQKQFNRKKLKGSE